MARGRLCAGLGLALLFRLTERVGSFLRAAERSYIPLFMEIHEELWALAEVGDFPASTKPFLKDEYAEQHDRMLSARYSVGVANTGGPRQRGRAEARGAAANPGRAVCNHCVTVRGLQGAAVQHAQRYYGPQQNPYRGD